MRLLNVETRKLEVFVDDESVPPYTILSHCWGEDEVTFQALESGHYEHLKGYEKIAACCRRTQLEQYQYTWVDTCCIDKSSSAELSEAINSMFRWYEKSTVCYVFLEDVGFSREGLLPYGRGGTHDDDSEEERFQNSRWFLRGWTLQELLAPNNVVFFDKDWKEMGSRDNLAERLSKITDIDADILLRDKGKRLRSRHSRIYDYSIAERMSWASQRETTRKEDEAYSLMGLFDVNMPLIYGEGKKAFFRLQQEIMRSSTDASILLWDDHYNQRADKAARYEGGIDMLALSPSSFSPCRHIRHNLGVKARNHWQTSSLEPTQTNGRLSFTAKLYRVEEIAGLPVFWDYGSPTIHSVDSQDAQVDFLDSTVRRLYLPPNNTGLHVAMICSLFDTRHVGVLLCRYNDGTLSRITGIPSVLFFRKNFAVHCHPRGVSTSILRSMDLATGFTKWLPVQRGSLLVILDLGGDYEDPRLAQKSRHLVNPIAKQPRDDAKRFNLLVIPAKPTSGMPSIAMLLASKTADPCRVLEMGLLMVYTRQPGATSRIASDVDLDSVKMLPTSKQTVYRIELVPQQTDVVLSFRSDDFRDESRLVVTLDRLDEQAARPSSGPALSLQLTPKDFEYYRE